MTDEKLKIWLGFAQFVLGTVVLGLVSTIINNAIQQREIELKEQEQVGTFLVHALQEDVGVRRRFAQYFSTVTRSEALRKGWTEYYAAVEQEYEDTTREKKALEQEVATRNLDAQEQERLNARIATLERALSPTAAPMSTDIAARVYIHIRDDGQRESASRVAEMLRGNAYNVPGIQRLGSGPNSTELRYFRTVEEAEANRVGALLGDLGVTVNVRYIPGSESSTSIRPRHYELWFSAAPIALRAGA
jgi:hypothetical protein